MGIDNTMKSFKILSGDPARSSDSFGVVGLEATWPERKIHIRYAKQFWNEPYGIVANHFTTLQKKVKPDMMILEKNFDYDEVSKAFVHLPITYVSTTGNMTEKNRSKGWAVDKPYMIKWLKTEYTRHTIQYPSNKTTDMAELINQQNEMVGITSPSGHVSYKRKRGRHDDLFLACLIGCNAIRILWDQN